MPSEPPDSTTFEYLAQHAAPFQLLDLRSLARWMKEHPDAFIVTDPNSDVLEGLKIVSNALPRFSTRVIPQVHYPQDMEAARTIGFMQVIWTLYRYSGTNEEVAVHARKMASGALAITMPKSRAQDGLASVLSKLGITTYTHRVDTLQEFEKFQRSFDIDEVYSALLDPDEMPER